MTGIKLTRVRTLFAAVLLIVVVSACARHEDLPAPLTILGVPIVAPPTPDLSVSTTDSLTFILTWSVNDPTGVVSYYRVYTMIPFLGTIIDSTLVANAQVDLGVVLPGLEFGVSSVTLQNVESAIDVEPAF